MRNKIVFSNAIAVLVLLAWSTYSFAGCGIQHKSGGCIYTEGKDEAANLTQSKDIVATAIAAGSFQTLVAAVKAAELVEVLQGRGPFTVFAPTDEAFAKLPDGTVDHLLKPENRSQLQAILTYHVVPGKVTSAQVAGIESAKTVQGKSIQVKVKDGHVMVDQAKVTQVDIEASNGVIHVIDQVILPDS